MFSTNLELTERCHFEHSREAKTKMKPLKVILSGGGTGGHIFPAVAIANEIKK